MFTIEKKMGTKRAENLGNVKLFCLHCTCGSELKESLEGGLYIVSLPLTLSRIMYSSGVHTSMYMIKSFKEKQIKPKHIF